VPVLDPGRGRTKQGYFWAMARDDRPWGGSEPPAVVYSYAPGRGHIHANTLLGGYRGILQCDGYAAYKKLVGSKTNEQSVTLAFCWSHVRRGFYDLAKTKGADRDGGAEAHRRALRDRGRASAARAPLTDWPCVRPRASRWLATAHLVRTQTERNCPARGPTAEAIRYALNHWAWAGALSRRRTHRTRHQQCRARHADSRSARDRQQPVAPVGCCVSRQLPWVLLPCG
jgi:transposase